MKTEKKKFHYAFIILLAVSLIRGISGPAINASSGLFLTPVSTDLGVGIGQLSLYLSISSIVTLIWLPIAGNLLKKIPVKTAALFSALLQTGGFMALGWMQSVWGFYLLSIPLAMGAVVLVNLLGPVLINRWFSRNIGLIMGIMMTITSLLGAVFQPLLTGLIGGRGWRFAYRSFGAVALAALVLIILLLLKDKPESVRQKPFGSHNTVNEEGSTETPSLSGISAKAALKLPSFYMVFIYMIILTGFASFSQHITNFGLDTGFAMNSIGSALSISMIGSAIGSILIGFFSDKAGIVPTSIAVMVTGLISIGLFMAGGSNFVLFAAASFLFGLASSSIGVVGPLLVTSFFGSKDYEKIFSYIMMGAPFASIVLMPAYGFIYDTFKSYRPVFLFLLAALILGAVCIFIGSRSSRHKSQTS